MSKQYNVVTKYIAREDSRPTVCTNHYETVRF